MFDIQLDLTKYLILWSGAFLVGFLGSFFLIFFHAKKFRENNLNSKLRYYLIILVISLFIGILLLVMAIYGLFNGLLGYISK